MKRIHILAAMLAVTLLVAGTARGQDQPVAQLKLQVVLNEMDGAKKISSLPYVLHVGAKAPPALGTAKLRVGLRVPIEFGGKDGSSQVTYLDIGTNIDCRAAASQDGRYRIDLTIERSSVYIVGPNDKPVEWAPGDPVPSKQPLVHQFRNEFELMFRDGQTIQSVLGADPVSGHVWTLDVTVQAEK